MKDSLFIDSGLLIKFLIKAMDTANYLQNRLSIKHIADNVIIIPEKAEMESR